MPKHIDEIKRLRETLRRVVTIGPPGNGYEQDALTNAREMARKAIVESPRLSEFEGYYPIEDARRLAQQADEAMNTVTPTKLDREMAKELYGSDPKIAVMDDAVTAIRGRGRFIKAWLWIGPNDMEDGR